MPGPSMAVAFLLLNEDRLSPEDVPQNVFAMDLSNCSKEEGYMPQ